MKQSDLANDKINNENKTDNKGSNKKIYIIIGQIVAAVVIIVAIIVIVVIVTKDNDYSSSDEEYINNYYLSKAKFTDDLKSKFTADLKFNGTFSPSGFKKIYFQNPNSLTPIEDLSILIELQCDEMIHIIIIDKNKERWESPYSIIILIKQKLKIVKIQKV